MYLSNTYNFYTPHFCKDNERIQQQFKIIYLIGKMYLKGSILNFWPVYYWPHLKLSFTSLHLIIFILKIHVETCWHRIIHTASGIRDFADIKFCRVPSTLWCFAQKTLWRVSNINEKKMQRTWHLSFTIHVKFE